MITIRKQLNAGNYTVLLLDSEIPHTKFSKLLIKGKEYNPEIVYDLKNSIGIAATGNFEGEEVTFIA